MAKNTYTFTNEHKIEVKLIVEVTDDGVKISADSETKSFQHEWTPVEALWVQIALDGTINEYQKEKTREVTAKNTSI